MIGTIFGKKSKTTQKLFFYILYYFCISTLLTTMVSSPSQNLARQVQGRNGQRPTIYGRLHDNTELPHILERFQVGHSIMLPDGSHIWVEYVVQGIALVCIRYPNDTFASYTVTFPCGQEIDNVEAYALDPVRNILYIQIGGVFYSVNLDDAHANDGFGEFVRW